MLLVKHPRCPFCHEEILATDAKRACEACMGWHHRECWLEAGDRCAACGSQNASPPPAAGADLSVHVTRAGAPEGPLLRPACCASTPCPRHAILASILLALSEESLRKIATRADLVLAPTCSAAAAGEVLRGVDVALPLVLTHLTRAELSEATNRLGLLAESATKRALQERLLERSQLIRVLHALPLDSLQRVAAALSVQLSSPRRVGSVRRELLLAPSVGLGGLLTALRRTELVCAARRLGLPRSGTKASLRARLRASARIG